MSDPTKPTVSEDSNQTSTNVAKNAVVKNWKRTSVGIVKLAYLFGKPSKIINLLSL
ncbi:MAG: hypothetical protein KME29_30645 [Calothrix sp. FI2-JRJ7]|jgi:hypothetical protein|nr:hypothetical protein [Calothrix sp. FI2-JRJ7]